MNHVVNIEFLVSVLKLPPLMSLSLSTIPIQMVFVSSTKNLSHGHRGIWGLDARAVDDMSMLVHLTCRGGRLITI